MRIEDSLKRVRTLAAATRMFERRSTPQMFRIYLERCDEILFANSTMEGLKMAQFGLLIAERGGVEDQAAALAVLGTAYRRLGQLDRAEEAFGRGLELAPLAGLARADLLQRRSVLRVEQRQIEEALVDAHAAVENRRCISRFGTRECESLAFALVLRGNVHNFTGNTQESLADNLEALTVTTPSLTPRTYASALNNVDNFQESLVTHEELAIFIQRLKEAWRHLTPRHGFARLKLQWVLANQQRRLGSTRKAEKTLRKIRPGLLAIHIREFLCASLDLVEICKFHNDAAALSLVLKEMAAAVASSESFEARILLAAAANQFLGDEDVVRLRSSLQQPQPPGSM